MKKLKTTVLTLLIIVFTAGFTLAETTDAETEADGLWPNLTIGPAIGGGGLLGFHLRYDIDEKFTIGVLPTLRPQLMELDNPYGDDKEDIWYSVMLPVEAVAWLKYRESAKGPVRHGIMLAGGTSVGKFPEYMGAVGWEYERFKNLNHIYNFALGVMVSDLTSRGHDEIDDHYGEKYEMEDDEAIVGAYFRVAWRW